MATFEQLAKQSGVQLGKKSPQKERQSILGGIAKDLATPFARAGVNLFNIGASLPGVIEGGIHKLTGNEAQARRSIISAGDEAVKVRNIPFLGETAPVLSPKESIGVGLQIGSTIAGGGAVKSVAGAGIKSVIKAGAKEGVKFGASTGAAFEGGRALSEDKSALEVLQNFLVGGAAGGVLGGTIGAALPVVGAGVRGAIDTTRKTVQAGKEVTERAIDKVRNIRNQVPGAERDSGIVGGIVENVRSTVGKATGSLERSKINVQAQREAREAFQKLEPRSQDAIRKGLLPRDVELIKAGSASEQQVYKRIVDAAEAYSTNRTTANRPSVILGEEFSKRINGLGRAMETSFDELDDAVRGLGDTRLESNETMNFVIERLRNTNGLKGIDINESGVLNFANTQLSGSNSATARKELQRIFDDVVQRADDPQRMHLYRKELFEDLGGKKSSGTKLVGTEEKGVNAMRQGMAEAIETVSPEYKAANTKVAKLLDTKKEIVKKFGEVSQGNEDIFDIKSSILLRRLTSNAKTGQDMAELIRTLEGTLGDFDIRFDTDLVRIQEFLNLLDRYYDIAPDTSLLGIMRADSPKSKSELIQKIFDIVGGNFNATDDTAKQAIKDLLEGRVGFNPAAVPQTVSKTSILGTPRKIDTTIRPKEWQEIQAKAFQRVDKNKDQIVKEYEKLNGNVLNTDDFREAFRADGYNGFNAPSVHEPASELNNYLFKKRIEQAKPGDTATWTIGGAGSGKTTAVKGLLDTKNDLFVFDSIFGNFEKGIKRVDMAVKKGVRVKMAYVLRDIDDAWFNGVVSRAIRKDRTVPLKVFLDGTENAQKSAISMSKSRYKDDIIFIDNTLGLGNQELIGVDKLKDIGHNNLVSQHYERLKQQTQQLFTEGKISKEVRDGLLES